MFWAYTICSRRTLGSENSLQNHSDYASSTVMLDQRGIFDYFTHFDLLETRALYDFYSDISYLAVNESRKDKLRIDRAPLFVRR
jgi:hypothetical protein